MSLKVFHLFFTICATLFWAGMGGWCLGEYQYTQDKVYLTLGICSFIFAGLMVVYFPWVVRKLKNLSYLAFALLILPTESFGCAVCFGNPDSPLVKGANSGIMFLLVVICLVVVAFWSVVFILHRRHKNLSKEENRAA